MGGGSVRPRSTVGGRRSTIGAGAVGRRSTIGVALGVGSGVVAWRLALGAWRLTVGVGCGGGARRQAPVAWVGSPPPATPAGLSRRGRAPRGRGTRRRR